MDTAKQSPLTTISIGPGICGIERGIESTGTRLDVLSYVEIESFIIENLVAEMEQGFLAPSLIWSDCKTFPSELFRGKVNLLLAGYPCQPFSNAGKRNGSEDPRHLWPYIERAVDIIRPSMCFFENVRGHVTLGLREVIASLEELGYRVHWGIFSAEETGASHKRERVFIMAVRKDILDDTSGFRSEQKYEVSTRRNSTKFTGELGNSKHNGHATVQKLRGNEEASYNGRQEKSEATWQSSGANRSIDEPCLSRSSEGSKLADTHNSGSQQNTESSELRTDSTIESSRDSRQTNTGETAEGWEEKLGHSNEQGLQRRNIGEREERSQKRITGANDSFAPVAKPGQPQHEWEAPRTAGYINRIPSSLRKLWSESRKDFAKMLGEEIWQETDFRIKANFECTVGCSINELRLREDFLRALGNAVYPPTATLAWTTLLKKFNPSGDR